MVLIPVIVAPTLMRGKSGLLPILLPILPSISSPPLTPLVLPDQALLAFLHHTLWKPFLKLELSALPGEPHLRQPSLILSPGLGPPLPDDRSIPTNSCLKELSDTMIVATQDSSWIQKEAQISSPVP